MRAGPAQLWPNVAPQWILNLPEWLEEFCYDIYKSFIFDDRYEMYVRGLGNTLLLTLMATLMGIVLGVVIALLRSTWDKNGHAMSGFSKAALRIVNAFCNVYLTVIVHYPHRLCYFAFLECFSNRGYFCNSQRSRTDNSPLF